MKRPLLYTILTLLLTGIISCAEQTEEKNSAVITITGPVEHGYIHHMDTLQIRGTIVSVLDLHGYNISIRRTDTNSEVFYYNDHYHSNDKHLNIDWVCDQNATVELELTITALLDHEGNAAIKSVNFNCMP